MEIMLLKMAESLNAAGVSVEVYVAALGAFTARVIGHYYAETSTADDTVDKFLDVFRFSVLRHHSGTCNHDSDSVH